MPDDERWALDERRDRSIHRIGSVEDRASRISDGQLAHDRQRLVGPADQPIFRDFSWSVEAFQAWVITGPNGSGKSNIADAILFALGENSPRTLRAAQGRLTGLIYDPKKEADADDAQEDKPAACRVSIQFNDNHLDR